MSAKIITNPSIKVKESILTDLLSQADEQGQVVMHVVYKAPSDMLACLIRIWPTSYLYDQNSDHRSELVHAENISYYPTWHQCAPGVDNYFTLVFSGLPRPCKTFDFIEHCGGSGGEFEILNIPRNKTDVYFVRM